MIISCNRIDINSEINKGINQYEQGKTNDAISTFSSIINETDTCLTCYLYRAFAYKSVYQYEKALNDINHLIKPDTSDTLGYANRASIYFYQKEYQKSLLDFKKALKINPENTIFYNPICHLLFITGEKDSVYYYYQKAINVNDTIFDKEIIEYCNNLKK